MDSPQPPPAVQLGGWVPFFEWLVAFEKLVKLSLFLELLKMPGKSKKIFIQMVVKNGGLPWTNVKNHQLNKSKYFRQKLGVAFLGINTVFGFGNPKP